MNRKDKAVEQNGNNYWICLKTEKVVNTTFVSFKNKSANFDLFENLFYWPVQQGI